MKNAWHSFWSMISAVFSMVENLFIGGEDVSTAWALQARAYKQSTIQTLKDGASEPSEGSSSSARSALDDIWEDISS